MKILNFGSLNLDYVYHVSHFVLPSETLSAKHMDVKTGGKGLNQSAAMAKAGCEVYHAGCVGKNGESLKSFLEEQGVHTEYLKETDVLQGNAVIQVNEKGENCILLYGGSNQCITSAQIEETLSHFGKGDVLVLQNEISGNPEIADAAYERGMRIILNPSPCDEKIHEIDFAKLSWLFVNEVEAEQISGTKDPCLTWNAVHEQYSELNLLVTLGEKGSIAFTPEETVRQNAFFAHCADSTGAGDTYTGYMIAGLCEGKPLGECMRIASCAAALSVEIPGAAASIPSLNEVMEKLPVMKERQT